MPDAGMTSRSFAGTIRRCLGRPYGPTMRVEPRVRRGGTNAGRGPGGGRLRVRPGGGLAGAPDRPPCGDRAGRGRDDGCAGVAEESSSATVGVVLLAALGLALALPSGLPNAVFRLPPGLVAMYSLGAYAQLDRALVGLAASMVALPLSAVRIEDATITDLSAPVFLFAAAWGSGRALRVRRLRDADLIELNETLLREQAEREAQATADERRRIARELHDIVAHRVTTIVIQAESGAATAEDPEQARRAFGVIAGSGREALDELRRLLGLLREGGEPSTRPPPGVGRIGELIDEVRQAGLTVEARIDPGIEPLPAGLDLAVYRVVQESLTNALRHGGSRASLEITRAADEVLIDIRNPLQPVAATDGYGAGRGLAGMRERTRVYGGTLTAQPVDREWVLRARLPVTGAEP